MKFITISLALVALLSADEMLRIESILEDISKLRKNYTSCKIELEAKGSQSSVSKTKIPQENNSTCQAQEKELKEYSELLKKEQAKNRILTSKTEPNSKTTSHENNPKSAQIIAELEKMLETQNSTIKAKDNEINALRKGREEKTKVKDSKVINLKNSKNETKVKEKSVSQTEDENPFPKLMMKESPKTESVHDAEVYTVKGGAYRLRVDSPIYDAKDGNRISEWSQNTSFTSNQRSNNWIKITGHFVNKVWQKSNQDYWVEESNVIKSNAGDTKK